MKTKKRVCIPIEERELNQVDKLKTQIKEIQENCKHDWKLINKPELRKSLVPGVFVGKTEPGGMAPEMILICTKCSQRLETSIISRCPYCLSPMREGGLYTVENDGTFSRKKYFGREYLYYAIRLHHCTKCDFWTASDEWNQ